jgi:pimeloyl-ACP methyl ester carboxylesterase
VSRSYSRGLTWLLPFVLQFPSLAAAQSSGTVRPVPAITGPLATAADQSFQSGDITIHFREAGTGDPVILVHGWSRNLGDWSAVAAALAPTNRVIAMDVRGFGMSGKSGDSSKFGLQMADDVIRLMDHLGIRRAHLAGATMGALIVANIASRYADRVSTVTLIAGPFADPSGAAPAKQSSADTDLLDRTLKNPQVMAYNDSASLIASWRSLVALDITAGPPPAVRALVMCGTADPVLPSSRRIAGWWPGARLVELPNATRAVLREAADEVATRMRAFFEQKA